VVVFSVALWAPFINSRLSFDGCHFRCQALETWEVGPLTATVYVAPVMQPLSQINKCGSVYVAPMMYPCGAHHNATMVQW